MPPECSEIIASRSSKLQVAKLKGYDLWNHLGRPKLLLGPMVDSSEYAWRILATRYGADLCWTPMLHARLFSTSSNYVQNHWLTGKEEHEMVVQFCANDPEILKNAVELVQDYCPVVELNLGCPQGIAKSGHYGAFLMDDWKLIADMVRKVDQECKVPIVCKIRIFPEVEKTIQYAKMLVEAGAAWITVHGRLREQRGHKSGLADWSQIKAVKEALDVPVFANGNILYHEDIERCIKETGVDGVMVAETHLFNPAIFTENHEPITKIATEFLEICKTVPHSSQISHIRGHLFKLYRPCLSIHTDLRDTLGKCNSLETFEAWVKKMGEKLEKDAEGWIKPEEWMIDSDGYKEIPHWLLQPYVRPDTRDHLNGRESKNDLGNQNKRRADQELPNPSKSSKSNLAVCPCKNVGSEKCSLRLCKKCCIARGVSDASASKCPTHGTMLILNAIPN